MPSPACPQNGPYGVELQAGRYFWCACGQSSKQPFCDGAHRGTAFKPTVIDIDSRRVVWFCGCKRTASAPHCDGAHKSAD